MNLYTTKGVLLYASDNKSLQTTIENAIQDGVALDMIDLKNKDLRNINFDNVIMRGADFRDSDLTGANMSECILDGADFSNAQLYNTCMAYSSLKHSSFMYSSFGATDLSQSIIDNSIFQGISTFNISFNNVKSMQNTKFRHYNKNYPMQSIPIHITGCQSEINVLDNHVLIEDEIFTHEDFEKNSYTINSSNDHIMLNNRLIAIGNKASDPS